MTDTRKGGSKQRVYVQGARDSAHARKASAASASHRSSAGSSGARSTSGTRSTSGSRSTSGARSASGSRSTSGSRGYSSRSGSGSRQQTERTKREREPEQLTLRFEEDDSLRDEITVIIVTLIGILMALSYLHLAGSFGEIVNKLSFGLMGSFAYVFPFAMVFVAVFAIANKRNRSIGLKTLYCAIMMIFVSGLVQLAVGGFDAALGFKDYFTNSAPLYAGADKTYGGFFGGSLCKLLCPYLGNAAATVVMVAGMIIFFLLIAGKAIFTTLAKRGIESAEEYRQRRIEEKLEEEEYEQEQAELEQGRGREKTKASKKEDYADEFDGLDDEFFANLEARKAKKQKGNIVDTLMRRGMGLDVERIADTDGYKKMVEEYGKTAEEVGEISQTASDGTAGEESLNPVPDGQDIVSYELLKKFGGRSPQTSSEQQEAPRNTKQGLTRTIMVDEAEEEQVEKVEKEEKQETAAQDGGSAIEHPSSGAASFTTPEQLAKLREENASKEVNMPYEFPPLSLLGKSRPQKGDRGNEAELGATVEKLQKTFESFGVGVTVTEATCGPTVTRYELLPDQGVKVKTITSLADDIKLALAASEIRIEAPIPGKAAVGIEVPNAKTSPVLLGDLLDSHEFTDAQSNLTFAVGKDIGGKTICFDIAGMPHMLIAGATGSGKSVCINALILSIIYKAKPTDVKLIMIDPKRVELIGYNGIPHLLVPVVTDVKKATGALNWAIAEMDDRYERFAQAGVNNLASYNRLMEEKYYEDGNEGECPDRLPQILIIVDELNDLMMTANSKEVEASICRLTQLARASGIHVVLATQRPSVNVITGTIKANIPSRIAFSVSSIVDSRTIIDQAGAEKLLGKGDMLFYPQGYPKPVRLQGAYVSDKEIASVVDFIKERFKEVKYSDKVSSHIEKNAASDSKGNPALTFDQTGKPESSDNDHDEFFEAAGRFIIEKQKASIGMLQRIYKIGFNRAARIMDQLSEEGVVGPEEGTKPRKILMTLPQFEAYLSGGGAAEDGEGQDYPSEPYVEESGETEDR